MSHELQDTTLRPKRATHKQRFHRHFVISEDAVCGGAGSTNSSKDLLFVSSQLTGDGLAKSESVVRRDPKGRPLRLQGYVCTGNPPLQSLLDDEFRLGKRWNFHKRTGQPSEEGFGGFTTERGKNPLKDDNSIFSIYEGEEEERLAQKTVDEETRNRQAAIQDHGVVKGGPKDHMVPYNVAFLDADAVGVVDVHGNFAAESEVIRDSFATKSSSSAIIIKRALSVHDIDFGVPQRLVLGGEKNVVVACGQQSNASSSNTPATLNASESAPCALCGVIFPRAALKFRTTAKNIVSLHSEWQLNSSAHRTGMDGVAGDLSSSGMGNDRPPLSQSRASTPNGEATLSTTNRLSGLRTRSSLSFLSEPNRTAATNCKSNKSPSIKGYRLKSNDANQKANNMYTSVSLCSFCGQFFGLYEGMCILGPQTLEDINNTLIDECWHLKRNRIARLKQSRKDNQELNAQLQTDLNTTRRSLAASHSSDEKLADADEGSNKPRDSLCVPHVALSPEPCTTTTTAVIPKPQAASSPSALSLFLPIALGDGDVAKNGCNDPGHSVRSQSMSARGGSGRLRSVIKSVFATMTMLGNSARGDSDFSRVRGEPLGLVGSVVKPSPSEELCKLSRGPPSSSSPQGGGSEFWVGKFFTDGAPSMQTLVQEPLLPSCSSLRTKKSKGVLKAARFWRSRATLNRDASVEGDSKNPSPRFPKSGPRGGSPRGDIDGSASILKKSLKGGGSDGSCHDGDGAKLGEDSAALSIASSPASRDLSPRLQAGTSTDATNPSSFARSAMDGHGFSTASSPKPRNPHNQYLSSKKPALSTFIPGEPVSFDGECKKLRGKHQERNRQYLAQRSRRSRSVATVSATGGPTTMLLSPISKPSQPSVSSEKASSPPQQIVFEL